MSEERLDDGKWYVLRVVSGKENKIKQAIESEVRRSKWSDIISQVLMPTEKVYQIKNGKKIVKERNFFPGYLMLETSVERLHGDILQTITSINGVVHFLGKENPNTFA
jgi:transcriptional antiterminator NusG